MEKGLYCKEFAETGMCRHKPCKYPHILRKEPSFALNGCFNCGERGVCLFFPCNHSMCDKCGKEMKNKRKCKCGKEVKNHIRICN